MPPAEVVAAERGAASRSLLSVTDLAVDAAHRDGPVRLVEGVSLGLQPGRTLGLVGESGSGKSVTAMAIGGLLPPGLRVSAGAIHFEGQDLARLSESRLRAVRGARIGFVFQDPQNSLDPAFTVGDQLVEAIRAHQAVSARVALDAAVGLLDRAGIAQARRRVRDYPHQFSGGMAQRVMIAIALCCSPSVLIADEPTTALDVTVQAQILELLHSLKDEYGLSLLLISHDFGVIAEMADEVAVMYAGQIVECGDTVATFARPRHPYTAALMAAQPGRLSPSDAMATIPGAQPAPADMPAGCRFRDRCGYAQPRCAGPVALQDQGAGYLVRCVRHHELRLSPVAGAAPSNGNRPAGSGAAGSGAAGSGADHPDAPAADRVPTSGPARQQGPGRRSGVVLEVRDLAKEYPSAGGLFGRGGEVVRAVDGVSFQLPAGSTLGLVGESGAGKSTVGRLVLGLTEPTRGTIVFEGESLAGARRRRAGLRRDMQVVFQNPYASLDPRMTVADIVAEPIDVHGRPGAAARRDAVVDLLERVGLDARYYRRYPHQMSGGQLQRVAIARALALNPALIVCDEPISSLDVSTQGQVVNLLKESQARLGLAYLFIGHNLAVVSHISDRVAVMYRGRIVELGDSREVYDHPKHPYTRQLLGAMLSVDPLRRQLRRGDVAVPPAGPSASVGCPYADRCPAAMEVCRAVDPPEVDAGHGTTVRCHLYGPGRPSEGNGA